jgi:hypothetical protein
VPDITPTQVHNLLTTTRQYLASHNQTGQARDQLGRLLLDTARRAKTSPRDLSAVTGLHANTVRALIARAAGHGAPDGWTQPELAIQAKPGRTASAANTRTPGIAGPLAPTAPAPARPSIGM